MEGIKQQTIEGRQQTEKQTVEGKEQGISQWTEKIEQQTMEGRQHTEVQTVEGKPQIEVGKRQTAEVPVDSKQEMKKADSGR